MSREVVVQEAVVGYFEARGWLCRAVVYAGRRGSPDRWFLRNGEWVPVEFKTRGRYSDETAGPKFCE